MLLFISVAHTRRFPTLFYTQTVCFRQTSVRPNLSITFAIFFLYFCPFTISHLPTPTKFFFLSTIFELFKASEVYRITRTRIGVGWVGLGWVGVGGVGFYGQYTTLINCVVFLRSHEFQLNKAIYVGLGEKKKQTAARSETRKSRLISYKYTKFTGSFLLLHTDEI